MRPMTHAEREARPEPVEAFCDRCGQILLDHEANAQSDFRGTCDDCLEDADPEAYEAKMHA